MTAGDEARRGRVDARGDARDADRGYAMDGPSLPERLLAARERKGVDLYRAERDTKIRAKYLAALETGEYAELPGAVYTKGFLRNYALYLGLDPDEVIRQWRRERGDSAVPAEPVLAVPRPLEAPRQGLTFSPVVVIAAPTLAIDSPSDGAGFENGAVPVKGSTTNAKNVAVSAVYTGAVQGQ